MIAVRWTPDITDTRTGCIGNPFQPFVVFEKLVKPRINVETTTQGLLDGRSQRYGQPPPNRRDTDDEV